MQLDVRVLNLSQLTLKVSADSVGDGLKSKERSKKRSPRRIVVVLSITTWQRPDTTKIQRGDENKWSRSLRGEQGIKIREKREMVEDERKENDA